MTLFVGCAMLGGPGVVAAAGAASFQVTGTGDGAGTCSGSSCPTLRAAVAASNAAGGTNTINVPAGTYSLTGGALNVLANVTITGAGASSSGTKIVGSGDQVFSIAAGAVTLTGTMITGGSQQSSGGAIEDSGAALTLTNDLLTRNTTSSGGFGGAVAMDGGSTTRQTLTVTGSTFTSNVAAETGGGGGGFGGAVYFGPSGGGSMTVTNTTFDSNTAQTGVTSGGGFGGAISFEPSGGGTLVISGTTFSANTAAGSTSQGGFGGAIDFEPSGTPMTLTVTNSTFTGNQAGGLSGFGGAIFYQPDTGATGTLTHVTIAGNSTSRANQGGGLEIEDAPMTIRNSIVSANTAAGATNDCDVSSGGSLVPAGHNIELGTTCGFDINANPLLGPLAGNGGPTKTMALLSGSPAIDAAAPALCPATDQRGVGRPDQPGTACDVGAFEFVVSSKPPPPPPPPAKPHKTKVYREKLSEKKHKATFWFKASGTIKGYQCALRRYDKKKHRYEKARWARCKAPKTYEHLKVGRYRFEVRAYNATGSDPKPAIKSFRI